MSRTSHRENFDRIGTGVSDTVSFVSLPLFHTLSSVYLVPQLPNRKCIVFRSYFSLRSPVFLILLGLWYLSRTSRMVTSQHCEMLDLRPSLQSLVLNSKAMIAQLSLLTFQIGRIFHQKRSTTLSSTGSISLSHYLKKIILWRGTPRVPLLF